MNALKQIGIIFGLCLIGEAISLLLPFTFPASLISMILMLVLLIAKIIKPETVKETSEFLLNNMAFLFVPSGVAIIEKYSLLKGKIAILILICIITTILTFTVTAFTVTAVTKLIKKGTITNEQNN